MSFPWKLYFAFLKQSDLIDRIDLITETTKVSMMKASYFLELYWK